MIRIKIFKNSKIELCSNNNFVLICHNILPDISQVWLFHNFASLLIMEPKLIRIALYYRIFYGQCKEAAQIFHAMKMVHTLNISHRKMTRIMTELY